MIDDEPEPVALKFLEVPGKQLRRKRQAMRHEQQRDEDEAGRQAVDFH
ncbi:hypothetical protein [Novosphingobium sp.]